MHKQLSFATFALLYSSYYADAYHVNQLKDIQHSVKKQKDAHDLQLLQEEEVSDLTKLPSKKNLVRVDEEDDDDYGNESDVKDDVQLEDSNLVQIPDMDLQQLVENELEMNDTEFIQTDAKIGVGF